MFNASRINCTTFGFLITQIKQVLSSRNTPVQCSHKNNMTIIYHQPIIDRANRDFSVKMIAVRTRLACAQEFDDDPSKSYLLSRLVNCDTCFDTFALCLPLKVGIKCDKFCCVCVSEPPFWQKKNLSKCEYKLLLSCCPAPECWQSAKELQLSVQHKVIHPELPSPFIFQMTSFFWFRGIW